MVEVGRILVVDINGAFAISGGEFGLAIKRDRAGYGAIGSVDGGGVFDAPIEGEDALGDGFIEDGIGIRVCLNGADRLQRLEIENSDAVSATVTGEAAAQVGSDSDAMHTLGIGDIANDRVGVSVEDDDMSAARDVDAAGTTVYVDVIPTSVAADWDGLNDIVALDGRRGRSGTRECCRTKNYRHCE